MKKGFTLAEVFHPLRRSKRAAFTLAEVLITLGIIGVVAALTMPALISKYQKHVWYTQFMKAATIIENTINQYNSDHGCGSVDDDGLVDNLCIYSNHTTSAAEKLGEYINVVQWINDDNYEEVCAGYKKLPHSIYYDGTNKEDDDSGDWPCSAADMHGSQYAKKGYAFITNDGILINTGLDGGNGSGSVVDINGPNKGPNIYGRDIFVFYLFKPISERWGYEDYYGDYFGCNDNKKLGYNCGARLLQEGKMNY